MVQQLFLGLTLLGSEWVLWILFLLSIGSIGLMLERYFFYKKATEGLDDFRQNIRTLVAQDELAQARQIAGERLASRDRKFMDLETEMVHTLLERGHERIKHTALNFEELAEDAILRARVHWERYLSLLATVGSNTPFFGLFGTVLGIIKAFHDLSQTAGAGATTVSSGISEALVATAIGLFVAIPAVIAFNLFQRRVKVAITEAEALKNYLIGSMTK